MARRAIVCLLAIKESALLRLDRSPTDTLVTLSAHTVWLGLVLLATSGFSTAQAVPQRHPAAVLAVQSAISALGGSSATGQISDSTIQGSMTDSSDPNSQISFVWQNAGSEFRYDLQTSPSDTVFLSGYGNPGLLQNGVFSPVNAYMVDDALPYHIPGLVLLNEFNNAAYSILMVGSEPWNNIPAIHIQLLCGSDSVNPELTRQDWYLDATSYAPLAVVYRVPDQMSSSKYSSGSISFGNFQQVSGVLVPFQLVVSEELVETVTVSSVQFNSGISPSTFDPPAVEGGQ